MCINFTACYKLRVGPGKEVKYKIHVVSKSYLWASAFYIFTSNGGSSADSASMRAACSFNRHTQRPQASSAETLLNQPARARTFAERRTNCLHVTVWQDVLAGVVRVGWPCSVTHCWHLTTHAYACVHWLGMSGKWWSEKENKNALTSSLSEDSSRGCVCRSKRSAFLALCYRNEEVSVGGKKIGH